jgi:hypothetical protein
MSTVEEIVKAIKELSPEKRDEVRRQLDLLWRLNSLESASDVENPDNPYWMLRRYINSNLRTKRARPRRPPIQIKGKPISETVVEDRRWGRTTFSIAALSLKPTL